MKKLLSVLLCVIVVASAFVACSNGKDVDKTTTGASGDVSTTAQITTDGAKIKDADAVNLMKSYSAKELGLTNDEMKDCSFMVANSGIEIDGKNYIKVIATIKVKHEKDGQETYTFDNKGEYYISYDGKQILQKDLKAEEDKYTEMEVKPVPTTEAPTAHSEETSKEAE